MRALHPAEARVTQALLAGDADVAEVAGPLPRRTRQTAQRRIEDWGWVLDRWVPSLSCVGAPFLTFIVARPFAERAQQLGRRWREAPGGVHAWSADGTFFGVFAAGSLEDAERLGSAVVPGEDGRTDLRFVADIRHDAVPAFFDFEGAWVRLARLEGVRAYPQGWLGGATGRTQSSASEPRPERLHRAMERALTPAVTPHSAGRGPIPPEPTARDAEIYRLVHAGWLRRRTFLDPAAVARVVTSFPPQLVFVWGTPIDGKEPGQIFPSLVGEASSSPFLFVATRTRVLAGFLGGSPPSGRSAGSGVLSVLRRFADRIESTRIPLGSVRPLIQHRQSGLLGRDPIPVGIRGYDATAPRATPNERSRPPLSEI